MPPALAYTRGPLLESLHQADVAVCAPDGRLLAHFGDPHKMVYLRSAAKPFQALPLVESGAAAAFGLTDRELALACASHAGLDMHAQAVAALQARTGLTEADLQCGAHPVADPATARALILAGQEPTPIRHNCSGKHTGMLIAARHNSWPLDTYLELNHPLQQAIVHALSAMTDVPPSEIVVGVDGCSAPNFAVPLAAAATAFARLADPAHLPPPRAEALRTLYHAMHTHPEMVRGPLDFDTEAMRLGAGRWVCKGGAEGYQAIAIAPGVVAAHAVGMTLKVADGAARPHAVALLASQVLKELGALPEAEASVLAALGLALPQPVTNWRGTVVGEARLAEGWGLVHGA